MQGERAATPARILLVDDTPANLFALAAVLKPLGATIVEASSGKQALSHLAEHAFAVVLLDVQMPEMDGFEVAARIRAMDGGRETPIIFLTAIHRDDGFVKRGYDAGAADYITKPFEADVVRARVRAFVNLFEQREEVRRVQVALRTHERDDAVRRLVAFERIATAALATTEIAVLFGELIAVFMSAADAADSATILIREGDELRVQACVGLNEDVDERYTVKIGEDFAGVVAAERRPLELSDASSSPLVHGEWIRARGTTILYGVPLLHGGELFGVAHIGSRRATSFSDADKRLFGAMADRAAGAVAEHMRRSQLLELERTARREAETASRMKDEFLATISHELRTPLNAILGWTVTARVNAPPEIDRALAVVERNARAQARMIEDVLDLSRVVSGRLRIETVEVVLNDVVDASLDAVRQAAHARNITVNVSIPERIVFHADAARFQQIVWNLLSNAIKFTPKGGTVEISASLGESDVTLRVSDSGDGIAPAFLPYIFEPFRQGDASTTRRYGGLGLGLAIVKQIVDAHGGTIAASSDGSGKGATFFVNLPRATALASVPPGADNDELAEIEPAGAALDGVKVLVVDDDEDARTLLALVLSEHGAVVAHADSASAAFSEVERFRPDVLVSDIAMPGGDGYGLMRAVRALPADRGGRTPAIAVTAHARVADGERAFAAGFQSHLPKPVDLPRLVSLVRTLSNVSD